MGIVDSILRILVCARCNENGDFWSNRKETRNRYDGLQIADLDDASRAPEIMRQFATPKRQQAWLHELRGHLSHMKEKWLSRDATFASAFQVRSSREAGHDGMKLVMMA